MNIKDKTGPLSRIMPAVSQVASNVWNQRVILKEHQMLTTLLFLIFMAIAQPLWHGYQFGVSDHSIQFSIMNRIMDDTLYPNDPMLDTAKGYVSFFPSLMVILIKATGDMEKLYFGLHILSYFLYFTLVYYITRLLFDRFSAVVCVSLMSTSKIVLGGSSIHFTGLYPSFFMLPFVLLAVYLFLRERYAVAYAILGVSLNFHTLISSYMFCMFFCHSALAIIFSKDSKVAAVKNLSKQAGLFALCALPALVWILSTHGEMTDEWIRLLRVRSSHHSFPLSWAGSHYVNFLLLLAAGALSFLYAPIANFHRKMLAFVFAIAILCTAGLVFAEYYPVKSVLRGQFFRSTNFLAIFCVMYVSNYLRHSWGRSILHKAACAIIFLALFNVIVF